MNPMQKSYSSFIESVCKQFDCTDAIRPLQDGFDALCESMTPGNQELVRYFRNLKPSSTPKDFSEMDGDVFTKHNPHFDRWVVHNTENAPEIYENGFRYGSEPGKLAYTDRYDSGRFAFATPLENATPPNFGENRLLPYCDTFDVGGSIVFKASGVTAFHKNDREDEVIFDKDSPEGCFWIRNVNHRAWENDTVDDESDHELVDRYEVIGNNPDRPLCTGTYDRCIRWCRDNGDAYAHMMKRWKARGNATKTESMMTPEDVEEVNATFKSLDEKLATSVPAQTEGVARMESMEAQYKAFIESVCTEFGCKAAISPLQEGFSALMESATPVLFHFLSPERFEDIALYNKFTPSTAEENHNGKGNRYMSFSRTGSFREGYPVLLQSDCGSGSDWGVVRLTLDGDLMNRYSTFKVGNGRGKPKTRHSMKFQPFDWANHDYGPDFGDECDIEDRVDNGKEWMMKSEGSFDVTLPYDDSDETMRTVFDNEGHPYSQAEDRMVTTAPAIPNVSRFIKRVDIVLVLGNFREDNEDDRLHFLDCLLGSNMKRKIYVYTSVKDCEHGRNEKPWNILVE